MIIRTMGFSAIFALAVCTTAAAQNQPAVQPLDAQALHVNLSNVIIVQEFVGDGDQGQCNGAAHGTIISQATSLSPAIRIDTDNRSGGCLYRIGIVDLGGHLTAAGFGLTMNFAPDGDAGQCGGAGLHQVPINSSFNNLHMTMPIRMDMDDRSGGCVQTWAVAGSKVALDVSFVGDGDAGQCLNLSGNFTAPPDVRLRLDTDSRSGGCLQQLRLRAVGHALDKLAAGPATTIVDAWRANNR